MPKATKGGSSNAWEPQLPVVPDEPAMLGPDDESAWGVLDGYDSWTLVALQEELVLRSLPKSGNKADLIERLRQDDGTAGS